ncbi:MAG: PAS domain S-box protein [Sterolibacterium sp.]
MKIGPYGIRQYSTWLTLVPLLIMAIGLELFFLHTQFADMDRDLLERGQLIARQLAASSEYGVFSNNRAFLATLARNALREPDVKAVMILNAEAEVIVVEGMAKARMESLFSASGRDGQLLDDGSEVLLHQPILATQVQLDEADAPNVPRQVGTVIIDMAWQRVLAMKLRLFWTTLAATAAFLLATLFLVFKANRPIVDAIRKLSEVVVLLGQGKLDSRAKSSSFVKELKSLGDGIDHMAAELEYKHATLEEARKQLNQMNRNLEETVAERTRQLSASLDQIKDQQQALQESEFRFRRAVEAAPFPIMLHVDDGQVLIVNQAFTNITGYRPDELATVPDWTDRAYGEQSGIAQQNIREMFLKGASRGEYRIRCSNGSHRVWDIGSVKLGQIAEGKSIAISMAVDTTERRRMEQRRIQKEREHRDTLVREVHHRIKNNLQSVAGLLQLELGKFMELDPRLETAISQINVIAVVHGLQGIDPNEIIRLQDVVRTICRTVSGLALQPLRFNPQSEDPALSEIELNGEEAVSLALVLNELILNAVKHGVTDGEAAVVTLSWDGSSAHLQIRNSLQTTPPVFDFKTGEGLGTGLSLVRSLLPEQGVQLTYAIDQAHFMLTSLALTFPVVRLAEGQEAQQPA